VSSTWIMLGKDANRASNNSIGDEQVGLAEQHLDLVEQQITKVRTPLCLPMVFSNSHGLELRPQRLLDRVLFFYSFCHDILAALE
jgi:hypothetical protein